MTRPGSAPRVRSWSSTSAPNTPSCSRSWLPIATPTVALARYLREQLAADTKIVYTGLGSPGLNNGDDVDACISFHEMEQLFRHFDASPAGATGGDESHTARAATPSVHRRADCRWPFWNRSAPLRAASERCGASTPSMSLARAVEGEDEPLGFVDVLPFDGALDHPALGSHQDLFVRQGHRGAGRGAALRGAGDRARSTRCHWKRTSSPGRAPFPWPNRRWWRRYWSRSGPRPATATGTVAPVATPAAWTLRRRWPVGRATLLICPYYMSRRYQEAARDATHDALTGLYSYRTLDARMEEEVARANRSGASLAVMFVDLDDFKRINDTYGHQTGNEILKGIGDVINSAIRATDIAARFGGRRIRGHPGQRRPAGRGASRGADPHWTRRISRSQVPEAEMWELH